MLYSARRNIQPITTVMAPRSPPIGLLTISETIVKPVSPGIELNNAIQPTIIKAAPIMSSNTLFIMLYQGRGFI